MRDQGEPITFALPDCGISERHILTYLKKHNSRKHPTPLASMQAHASDLALFLRMQAEGTARFRKFHDEPVDMDDMTDAEPGSKRYRQLVDMINDRGVLGLVVECDDYPDLDHMEQQQAPPTPEHPTGYTYSVGWIGSLWGIVPDDYTRGNCEGFLSTMLEMLCGFADAIARVAQRQCASL